MIHIHISILTKLAPGVIFHLSQAGQMEDQPKIRFLLSYFESGWLFG